MAGTSPPPASHPSLLGPSADPPHTLLPPAIRVVGPWIRGPFFPTESPSLTWSEGRGQVWTETGTGAETGTPSLPDGAGRELRPPAGAPLHTFPEDPQEGHITGTQRQGRGESRAARWAGQREGHLLAQLRAAGAREGEMLRGGKRRDRRVLGLAPVGATSCDDAAWPGAGAAGHSAEPTWGSEGIRRAGGRGHRVGQRKGGGIKLTNNWFYIIIASFCSMLWEERLSYHSLGLEEAYPNDLSRIIWKLLPLRLTAIS